MEGEVVLLESTTHFPQHEIIETIIKTGKPVIITSDKQKTPSKVQKIARSLGAQIYEPKEDLTQQKKKDLGMGANDHELDALASAKNAYNNLQREVRKIKTHAEEEDLEEVEVAKKYFDEGLLPKKENEEEGNEQNKAENEDKKEDEESKNASKQSSNNKKLKRMENKIENLEDKINSQEQRIQELIHDKQRYQQKYENSRENKRKEVIKEQEISKRDGKIKRQQQKIESLEKKLQEARIRETQYKKAIRKVYNDAEVIPILEELENDKENIEKVAIRNKEKQDIYDNIAQLYSVDRLKGVELKEYFVVEEFPGPDFEQVIQQYKDQDDK